MCEAAQIIGFWENLMRNVCIHMKMSAHYWDVLWNWSLRFVSLLSRRNNRDTSDSFVIFLSQYAVLLLWVFWYLTEAPGPTGPLPAFQSQCWFVCLKRSHCVDSHTGGKTAYSLHCVFGKGCFLANIGALYCTVPLSQ